MKYTVIQKFIRFLLFVLTLLIFPALLQAKDVTPSDVYAQMIQIQKELSIIKQHFNISADTQHEKILKAELKPRHAWQKAYEIMVKINILRRTNGMAILESVNIEPPVKIIDAKPSMAFNTALKLLSKVSELESSMGFEGLDLAIFLRKNPNPGHVYEIAEMIISEIQVIKASLGIRYVITPAAKYYTLKTPAEVNQVLGWSLSKLTLISSLR